MNPDIFAAIGLLGLVLIVPPPVLAQAIRELARALNGPDDDDTYSVREAA